jgi:hypothetical protein
MEMMMTCRGGLSESHEQAERIEARARIVEAVVNILGADLRRMPRIESFPRRRIRERFVRDRFLTGPDS